MDISTTISPRTPCLPYPPIQVLDKAMYGTDKGGGALGVLAPPSIFVPGHKAGLLVKSEIYYGGQDDIGVVLLTQKDARRQAKRKQITPPFVRLYKSDAGLWANLLRMGVEENM